MRVKLQIFCLLEVVRDSLQKHKVSHATDVLLLIIFNTVPYFTTASQNSDSNIYSECLDLYKHSGK